MIGATFCSGIGAPEVAAPWVDWRLASEIEPFPRAVLQDRFGHKDARHHLTGPRLWGDMTALKVRHMRRLNVPLPDLIVAGTPCQSFSVAGLRNGTADPRGNLTLQFVRTCHAIVNARLDGKLAVIWENVPGILSSRDNAFGAFLGGLVGAVDALPQPRDGSWPREGMVQGPRARAAWAVLDARWFGVAQRRRRVFVVVDFGGVVDPAAILLEPDRLRGDTPPRRETGQSPSGTSAPGAGTRCEGHHGDTAGTVSAKWVKGSGGPAGDETQNMVAFDCKGTEVQFTEDGSHPTLRSMGRNTSHQNAGGHAAVAFDLRGRDEGAQVESVGDTASLRAADGGSSRSYVAVGGDTTHSLTGEGHDASEDGTGRGRPVVAFSGQMSVPQVDIGIAPTLGAKNPTAISSGPVVRRLMPVECARLQGFPDHHTAITYRGRPATDGPQYKAYGNSMAVPVVRWIMDRIRISHTAVATQWGQHAKQEIAS